MARLRSKRILVAGGAGFLGSHLCERLLGEGHEIVCVDNYQTGSPFNVQHLLRYPGFRLMRHDIVEPLSLEVDEIYNLACPASPPHYQFDPVHTVKTSVIGALNLLDLAQRCGAAILQASTSEIYGDPLVHPQTESYWGNVNPTGPRACYDEGKRCAETLFFDYHRRHGARIKVARIFNTFGPRMHHDDGRIVSNFVVQALRGEPITVYGDGRQTRSFCFVSDLIEALVRLMGTGPAVVGPVNLGNPVEVRVIDLAKLVLKLTQSRSRIEFRPLPVDDPKRRKPDIGYAEQVLKWRPRTSTERGLRQTIDYFRAWLASQQVGVEARVEAARTTQAAVAAKTA